MIKSLSVVLAILAGAAPALASDPFPTRPVRIVVNTAPGGSLDVVTRIVAQHMTEKLGQSVIVDNRAGADGLVGVRAVQGAKPDGYTILAASGTFVMQPMLKKDAGYEPLKDFKPVGLMGRAPFLLMVGSTEPDKSVTELVGRARANPGKLTYASAGLGTATHLPAALFAQQMGLQMQHIPYKGNGPAFADVAAGRVNVVFTAYSSAIPHLQSERLRPLAVSSTSRLPMLPQVPTMAEQGVTGYSFYVSYGLMAPAGTPNDVVQKLSEALRSALNSKELTDRFRSDGTEAAAMSPEEFTGYLRQEQSKLGKLVSDLGLAKD